MGMMGGGTEEGGGATKLLAAKRPPPLLVLVLLVAAQGALAFSPLVMRDAPSTPPEPPRLLSRKEWAQGLAGAAGVGAVALGGQRAVRAAQEEREVLVRRPVFSERLYDTRRRSYLPVDPYLLKSNRALDRPVVCVGEVHDDNRHHFAEHAILKVKQTNQ
jgi:hypothetical protein